MRKYGQVIGELGDPVEARLLHRQQCRQLDLRPSAGPLPRGRRPGQRGRDSHRSEPGAGDDARRAGAAAVRQQRRDLRSHGPRTSATALEQARAQGLHEHGALEMSGMTVDVSQARRNHRSEQTARRRKAGIPRAQVPGRVDRLRGRVAVGGISEIQAAQMELTGESSRT